MDRTRGSHVHGRVHLRLTTIVGPFVVSAVLTLPLRVHARAIEPAPPSTPAASLVIEGELAVIEGDVHVICGSFDALTRSRARRARGASGS